KTKPHTHFSTERVRTCYTTRSNEVDRCSERTGTEITAKVVAKVGAIRQIEKLNERRKVVMFLELEVLGDTRIKLEEPLPTEIVEGGKLTLPGSQTIAELDCTGARRTGRIDKCSERRFQIG